MIKTKVFSIILLVGLITNSFSAGSSGAPKDTLYEKAVNLINVAKKMEEKGILLPVIYSEIKYLLPLKFDDIFVVNVGISELPVSRLKLNYEIEITKNKKICFGFWEKHTSETKRKKMGLHCQR